MKRVTLLGLVILNCATSFSRCAENSSEAMLEDAAGKFLKIGIEKIINSESGAKYFSDLKGKPIEISDKMESEEVEGWIRRWSYKKGDFTKPNPDKNAKSPFVAHVETDDGIIFQLFISYKRGNFMVRAKNVLTVSENPKVFVCYTLVTKDVDHKLEKEVQDVCENLKRALGEIINPPDLSNSESRESR